MKTPVPVTREAMDQVIRRIKHAMLDKDWNQADLARQLGVTEGWVSRRLKRHTELSVIELFVIAEALDVPAALLVSGASKATGWEPQVRVLPPRRSLLPGDRPVRYSPPLAELADAA